MARNSLFTKWRDTIQFRHRFEHMDSLELRAMLGSITQKEITEAQRSCGGSYVMMRSNSEPAKIFALNTIPFLSYLALGVGMGCYGKFVRNYSFLWLGAAALPALTYLMVARGNQPNTTL